MQQPPVKETNQEDVTNIERTKSFPLQSVSESDGNVKSEKTNDTVSADMRGKAFTSEVYSYIRVYIYISMCICIYRCMWMCICISIVFVYIYIYS
jgi:hypothetical protein